VKFHTAHKLTLMAHSPAAYRELGQLVAAATKYNRVMQAGTQIRSGEGLQEAVAWVRAGNLGKITAARGFCYKARPSIGKTSAPTPPPPSINYDMWTGPAPLVMPHRNFPKNGPVHYDWHWVYLYGNGDVGNQGIHQMDVCRWFLGEGMPLRTLSVGGRLGYVDDGDTPNTQVCVFDFGDKTIVAETRGLKTEPFREGFTGGWLFHGTEGSIAGNSLFDHDGKMVSTFTAKRKSENHFANFIGAVRSRKREDLNAEIVEGHQSTALCHMGNISWRLGKPASVADVREQLGKLKVSENVQETLDRTLAHLKDNKVDVEQTKLTLGVVLTPDGDRERFVENDAANALLTRDYRKPFVVPTEAEV